MKISDNISKIDVQIDKNAPEDMYDIDLDLKIVIEENLDGCSTNTVTCTCPRCCK